MTEQLKTAPVAAQPTKHYRTLRGNWTNTTTHVCNHCGFETRSEHRIVAHQCDVRKAAQPQQAKPLSDEEIDAAVSKERDALLDHIYEHTTLSEGILPLVRKLAIKAIEAARGIKEQG